MLTHRSAQKGLNHKSSQLEFISVGRGAAMATARLDWLIYSEASKMLQGGQVAEDSCFAYCYDADGQEERVIGATSNGGSFWTSVPRALYQTEKAVLTGASAGMVRQSSRLQTSSKMDLTPPNEKRRTKAQGSILLFGTKMLALFRNQPTTCFWSIRRKVRT